MTKHKQYTFKCPCCGCEDLVIKTCMYVYVDVQSLELKSIAGSEFKYYSYEPGDQYTEHGGNMSGVGIEMCVNESSDFEKTVDNTARLAAVLLNAYNLDIDALKRHHDFSGKNCPAHYYKDEDWRQFVELVKSYMK